MKLLIMNVALALMWALITAQVTPGNLIIGFFIGYGVLWLSHRGFEPRDPYFGRFFKFIWFLILYLRDLVHSNLRVAYDVITPSYHMKPGVVGVPLDVTSDAQIAILANLITLTPGTLSVDLSEDRKTLYLHVMYLSNPEDLRREIKDGLERRVLELSQ
jgi:multicomponent Na+:H+ antiporter subunit E